METQRNDQELRIWINLKKSYYLTYLSLSVCGSNTKYDCKI